MEISQPTVTRIIAALERNIGAALLTRNTRAVALTEAESDYFARVETILAAMDEAEHAARGTGELRGVLLIASCRGREDEREAGGGIETRDVE